LKSPIWIYKKLGKQSQDHKPKSILRIKKNNRPIMKRDDGDLDFIINYYLPAHLNLVEEI
jgi:hypothetical protein